MGDDALYVRVRALCCAAWGVPPWEFDRAADDGRVAAEDVIEAALLRASGPLAGDVLGYLFREKAAAKRRRLEAMKALVAEFRATTDPARRDELGRLMTKLNEE